MNFFLLFLSAWLFSFNTLASSGRLSNQYVYTNTAPIELEPVPFEDFSAIIPDTFSATFPHIRLEAGTISSFEYQTAGIYWLPDYVSKNGGYGYGGRTNDNAPSGDSGKACSKYGYEDCLTPKSIRPGASPVHPVQGLDCYKTSDCICPPEYKYTNNNCYQFINGLKREAILTEKCGGKAKYCTPSDQFIYNITLERKTCSSDTSCSKCPVNTTPYSEAQNRFVNSVDRTIKARKCLCSTSDYPSAAVINNADCSQSCTDTDGNKSYKCICKNGYSCSDGTTSGACVAECCSNSYDLAECPVGGVCSSCGKKYKLENCDIANHFITFSGRCVCDSSNGWIKSADGLSCVAAQCPTNYSNTVTSCDSSSTKPDLSCSDISGGKECCLCKCNASCDIGYYNLTVKPENAEFETCTGGCGTERATRYHLTNCYNGFTLDNGSCVKEQCISGTVEQTNIWCAPAETNCNTLGYTLNLAECTTGKILNCPFDTTKVACMDF